MVERVAVPAGSTEGEEGKGLGGEVVEAVVRGVHRGQDRVTQALGLSMVGVLTRLGSALRLLGRTAPH